MPNSIGEYLKRLREEMGLAQAEIAKRLSISRQTYSHYETGRIHPPTDTLLKLARLFQVPVTSFLEYEAVDADVSLSLLGSYIFPPNSSPSNEQIVELFREYCASSENERKLSALSVQEKRLLFYFSSLCHNNLFIWFLKSPKRGMAP